MENCVYCKIIEGKLPTVKIYEDEDFLVIQSLGQNSKGHSLIIPKKHSEDILEMNNNLGCKFFEIVKKVGNAMIKGLEAEGFNLIFNTKSAAGQVIMHTHCHIIPRYKNDGLKCWHEHQVSEEDRLLFAEKIIKEL
ncbi:MAG: HIT family protein [Candidatus Woesearchaeota archaeon]